MERRQSRQSPKAEEIRNESLPQHLHVTKVFGGVFWCESLMAELCFLRFLYFLYFLRYVLSIGGERLIELLHEARLAASSIVGMDYPFLSCLVQSLRCPSYRLLGGVEIVTLYQFPCLGDIRLY